MNDIYKNNDRGNFMKYGVRKPSVKKSISARTTGVSDILNDNEPEEPTVLGTIGAFFQLLLCLIQLAFWIAIVVGIIYLIVKIIF